MHSGQWYGVMLEYEVIYNQDIRNYEANYDLPHTTETLIGYAAC